MQIKFLAHTSTPNNDSAVLIIRQKQSICFLRDSPSGPGPPHSRGVQIHTTTHYIRQDSSGQVISSSQIPLPDDTQHLQQKNIHVPGGIGTHNLSRRAAVDLHLRPRDCWDRQKQSVHD
jgi:hypothetical protein